MAKTTDIQVVSSSQFADVVGMIRNAKQRVYTVVLGVEQHINATYYE